MLLPPTASRPRSVDPAVLAPASVNHSCMLGRALPTSPALYRWKDAIQGSLCSRPAILALAQHSTPSMEGHGSRDCLPSRSHHPRPACSPPSSPPPSTRQHHASAPILSTPSSPYARPHTSPSLPSSAQVLGAPSATPVVPAYSDPGFARVASPRRGPTMVVREHGGWGRWGGAEEARRPLGRSTAQGPRSSSCRNPPQKEVF
jgi:hypothetical protein